MIYNKNFKKKYVRYKINVSYGYFIINFFFIRFNLLIFLYGKFLFLVYVSNIIFIYVFLIIIMCIDLYVWDICLNVVIYCMLLIYFYVSYIKCICK